MTRSANPVGLRSIAARALGGEAWHSNRARLTLSVVGVALGVALGVAVHLINGSAIDEFASAARHLSGDADLVIRGPLGGFDEALYPRIAALDGVDVASPALDFDVRIPAKRALHVVAVDPFEALRIQPSLFGARFDAVRRLLEPDAIVLSRAAADDLGVNEGGKLVVQAGIGAVTLDVIAVLAADATTQRIAYADIGSAQWRLQRLGAIDRIDVRIASGADRHDARSRIAALLPPGVHVSDIDADARDAASMTRAYRINLDMLALVALFTGAFLVYATQALTILQRRTDIAVLRVLGVTRGGIVGILLAESAIVGAIGAALGLAIGYALAAFALTQFGGDLGAGYFGGTALSVRANPVVLVVYFCLGVAASIAGCVVPAWKAASEPPAPALKATGAIETRDRERPLWPGIALLVVALPLSLLPAIDDLPVAGYAAVAALLAGALWLVPWVSDRVLAHIPASRNAIALVAAQQLRGGNNQLGLSIAAIVVSFSLMVAMLIMIGSFRGSLERWLVDVLPADVYARAGGAGSSGFLDPDSMGKIRTVPSVERAMAVRVREVRIDRDGLPLTVLARDGAEGDSFGRPPMIDAASPSPASPSPASIAPEPQRHPDPAQAWISEAAADLHRWGPGMTIELPLGSSRVTFTVAGVWRDYTRQNGTVLIDRARYVAATSDDRVNDVWIWLKPGRSVAMLSTEIDAVLGASGLVDVRDAASIRRVSMSMFDRTFAVTYLLEGVAVLIGLFGISVGFGSQVLARRGEFGVLRHIGVTRGQVAALLGIEGLAAGIVGIVYGLATGGAISVLLVHVINRQSFHWSMDMHVPGLALLGVSVVLVVAATLTAIVSGRQAMTGQPIVAVKEDW